MIGAGCGADRTGDIEYWTDQLEAGESDERIEAIRGLADCGEDAIPLLTEVLDPWREYSPGNVQREAEQREAAMALAKIGPPALPALLKLLKSPNETGRGIGAAALAEMGPEARDAVPSLLEILQKPRAEYHPEAAAALTKIGADPATAVPVLTQSLFRYYYRDGHARAMMDAAKALNATPTEYAHSFLHEYKGSPPPWQRGHLRSLIIDLQTLCGSETGPLLIASLGDADADEREGAVYALGHLMDCHSRRLSSRDPEIVAKAWGDLNENFGLSHEELERHTVPLLDDDSLAVRFGAVYLCYCFGVQVKHCGWRVELEAIDKVALDLLKSAERLGTTDQFAAAMLSGKTAVSREAIPHLIAACGDSTQCRRKGQRSTTEWLTLHPSEGASGRLSVPLNGPASMKSMPNSTWPPFWASCLKLSAVGMAVVGWSDWARSLASWRARPKWTLLPMRKRT